VSVLKARPLSIAAVLAGSKASAADLTTQKVVQQKPGIDWNRNAAFATFGLFYQGIFQYGVFSVVYERIFPGTTPLRVCAKVATTLFVVDPCFFFPTFYTIQTAFKPNQSGSIFADVLHTYQHNLVEDICGNLTFWIPGHLVTFSLPTPLRMVWVASLSFAWVCVISWRRGDTQGEQEMADE
jgi:hypothetical protein